MSGAENEAGVFTCPLIDVTTFGDLPDRVFLRGDPTGSGCPLHETIEMRTALWTAEHKARYGDPTTPEEPK